MDLDVEEMESAAGTFTKKVLCSPSKMHASERNSKSAKLMSSPYFLDNRSVSSIEGEDNVWHSDDLRVTNT